MCEILLSNNCTALYRSNFVYNIVIVIWEDFMNRPILLDYMEKRVDRSGECPFVYDYSNDMSMMAVNGDTVPFISVPLSAALCYTQTRVKHEVDDEEFSQVKIVNQINESTKYDSGKACFDEMLTKTDACREQDDESLPLMLELISKTFANKERDDEDGFVNYE